MRHIIPISGKDSLATALVQTARVPDLPYEYIFNDVGSELPETYEWLAQIESKTGWQVQRFGRSLEQSIEMRNGFLPNIKVRFCTRKCKIAPMKEELKGYDAVIYYGLRADEIRIGLVPIANSSILPSYPLREMGIDLRGVYAILDAQDLMPPSFEWKRLKDAVTEVLANRLFEGWQEILGRAEQLVLFAGRSRSNCYFCFFQRLYEWVWLYEVHPDLFERAASFEKASYTWRDGLRLADLANDADRREQIFLRRVAQVVEYVERKRWNPVPLETDNEIAATSCGLLCGK